LGEGEVKKLAFCLNKNEAEFYGSTFCADCEKTKELFGQSFKLIHYVDCGKELENCPNIQNVPAWFIEKEIHYGLKNITGLKKMSGCIVNQLSS
jgi:arsenate reductase-like glutaredoxin family protein